jgi:hypothetical protein
MFDRMVSQLWGSFRIGVINQVVRGANPHSRAVQQLCSRKFKTDEGKRMSVEPKKDMKKRIKRSPDDADAVVLLHALALKHGLSGAEPDNISPFAGQGQQRAPVSAPRYSGHSQRGAYGGR